MIVISDKPGQLGNLLYIYSSFLAHSYEYGIKISNPAFHNYLNYFEGTHKRSYVLSKIQYTLAFFTARLLHKLKLKLPFIYVKCLDWHETFNLDAQNKDLSGHKLCLLQGWSYRGMGLVSKYKKEILQYFKPTKEFSSQIDSFFKTSFNLQNEIPIAIHIRRGDYKNFEAGKYYYSNEEYSEIIDRTAKLFENKSLHFLICSNEKVDLKHLNVTKHKMTAAPNHELLDMYCMARCKYIVAPPSTYSLWASFYGEVPLCMIHDLKEEISLGSFKTR